MKNPQRIVYREDDDLEQQLNERLDDLYQRMTDPPRVKRVEISRRVISTGKD